MKFDDDIFIEYVKTCLINGDNYDYNDRSNKISIIGMCHHVSDGFVSVDVKYNIWCVSLSVPYHKYSNYYKCHSRKKKLSSLMIKM